MKISPKIIIIASVSPMRVMLFICWKFFHTHGTLHLGVFIIATISFVTLLQPLHYISKLL